MFDSEDLWRSDDSQNKSKARERTNIFFGKKSCWTQQKVIYDRKGWPDITLKRKMHLANTIADARPTLSQF